MVILIMILIGFSYKHFITTYAVTLVAVDISAAVALVIEGNDLDLNANVSR